MPLAFHDLPQFPAVCGDQLFFQWACPEFHHDVVAVGGNQAVTAFKVQNLQRLRIGEVQCLLDTICFIVLQIEDDLGFAVVDDTFAETPFIQIEEIVQVLTGTDRRAAIAADGFENL